MRKKHKYIALLSALFWSLTACEFSPSEIPMTEIEKPSEIPPSIGIDLNPMMDTLRLSEPAWVTYSVETGDKELYQIDFKIDNVAVANLNYESAKKVRAYINSNSLENGVHELKITTYTATNSGSIADKTGNEAFWYELKWPVLVNKQAKDNFKFNTIKIVPEGIKVSWPKYRYADFDRYEFSWSLYTYKNGRTTITDPNQNTYIDENYVEGCLAYYSVFTYYTTGGFRYDNLSYSKEIKNPEVTVTRDCSVDIRWNHPENEKNVQLYCIKTSAPTFGAKEELDLTDLNDTTVSLKNKIGFGGDYQAQLRYIPKEFNSTHVVLNTVGGITNFALGDSIPRFQKAFQVKGENALLIYKDGTFSKYNLLTKKRSATISVTPIETTSMGTITGSPDGNNFGYFENQEYVIRRSSDLSVVNKMNIEAYDGYNYRLNDISVSNNGLVGTVDHYNNLRIFNISTKQKVFEKHFENNTYPRKLMISPDGNNLAVMVNDYSSGNNTWLVYYSFDGTQLTELGRVNGVGQDVWSVLAFSPQTEQKLVVSRWRSMYEYNVEVRDSRTFGLLYSIQVPMFFVPVVYDFSAERVIAQFQSFPTEKYSLLMDLKTGSKKKTVQFAGKEPLIFTGGNVFAGNGRSIKIDDFVIE